MTPMPTLDGTTEILRLLADPTRLRLCALLAREELSVAEIVGITHLPQSRVSTHLGKLREAEIVRDRRSGASSFYALNEATLPEETRRLVALLRESTDDPLLQQDGVRAAQAVRARASGSSWADSVAGSMERHYSPGRTWEGTLRGLLGLMHLGDVLDVASGDGALAELIAERARSLTCLDRSATVIAAAERRLRGARNVRFVVGDMHQLPFPDDSFDQVMLLNCLTHSRAPRRVLAEAGRVLKPGGDLAGITLKAHRHEAAAQAFDHVRMGFSPRELRTGLEAAGLTVEACQVTSREKRPPHFEVITVHARKVGAPTGRAPARAKRKAAE